MADPTVMLLDDDTNTRVVLHSILEGTPANVVECENEKCVLKWCSEKPQAIDLLVADVVLGYNNGPAVVRKLRPLQPSMRLLFISGFSLPELRKRGLIEDADLASENTEFLQKPFTAKAFLGSVEKLLETV